MERLTVIRKRLIPNEEIDISGDEQLFFDGNLLVTRWLPIRPRRDIGWGISHTYIKEGYKVSAVYDCEGYFKHWYWDIIEAQFESGNRLVVKDLLIDVVVEENFTIKILDLQEFEEAMAAGLICQKEHIYALNILKKILADVLDYRFPLQEVTEGIYIPPVGFRPNGDRVISGI